MRDPRAVPHQWGKDICSGGRARLRILRSQPVRPLYYENGNLLSYAESTNIDIQIDNNDDNYREADVSSTPPLFSGETPSPIIDRAPERPIIHIVAIAIIRVSGGGGPSEAIPSPRPAANRNRVARKVAPVEPLDKHIWRIPDRDLQE